MQSNQRSLAWARLRLAAAMLAIATGLGCAPASVGDGASAPALPRFAQLAGCYRVEIGAWEETGQHKGLVPPAEFTLDTIASTSRFARFEARRAHPEPVRQALPEAGFSRKFPGMWYPVGRDSLRVEWTTGLAMGGYRLAVRGDSVEGIATTWVDFRRGPPDPSAPVRGRRVDCAAAAGT